LIQAGCKTELFAVDNFDKYIWITVQKAQYQYYYVIINNGSNSDNNATFELRASSTSSIWGTNPQQDLFIFQYLFPVFAIQSQNNIYDDDMIDRYIGTEYTIDWDFDKVCDFYKNTGKTNFEVNQDNIKFVGKSIFVDRPGSSSVIEYGTVDIDMQYKCDNGINKILVTALV
jgi:hypothetical protein